MKVLGNFSRIFTGLVFIFSGFVKVVDPLGSAYKFTDYFTALGLDFLAPAALTLAIIMSVAELVIGIALLFNLFPKLAAWGLLLFMGFFTPLTLWLAVANPVSDCGCFGDALILTNWETFYKNLIILAFTAVVFIYRKRFKPAWNPFFQWSLGIFFTLASTVLAFHCLRNLPVIDFRPYHIGANIPEGMTVPEDQKDNKDVYESTFIYEKDGKQQEFTADKLPDTTWKFVDAKHTLLKEGYKPPIHDFTIEPVFVPGYSAEPVEEVYVNLWDALFIFSKDGETLTCTLDSLPDNTWQFEVVEYETELNPEFINLSYLNAAGEEEMFNISSLPGADYIMLDAIYSAPEAESSDLPYGEDVTATVLADTTYTFFAVMTKLSEANEKHLGKLNDIAKFCKTKGYKFYCLTASNLDEITEFTKKHKPEYMFCNTDPITLKTVVRSSPGLVLVKNGTILNKWAAKNIPTVDKLNRELTAYSITDHQKDKNDYKIIIFILSTLLFMSIFNSTYKWLVKNKYINDYK
ncbi:MAG: DoxX family protein [Bacteroidales bacterium]|nr:DoxX family protein [Bacteroidales bacterium]